MSHDEGNEDFRDDGNMEEVSQHGGIPIYLTCIANDRDEGHDQSDG